MKHSNRNSNNDQPELPPLRTFKVTREGGFEDVYVQAHVVTPSDRYVTFSVAVVTDNNGEPSVGAYIRRVIWEPQDVEEVTTPNEPSTVN